MVTREQLIAYVYFPTAAGLAELAADSILPSSKGVTNPVEEIAEGFLAAEAGVILGAALYRAVCKRRGKPINLREESGFGILGGVVGLIGMTATGLVLHKVWGVTDVRWWP